MRRNCEHNAQAVRMVADRQIAVLSGTGLIALLITLAASGLLEALLGLISP